MSERYFDALAGKSNSGIKDNISSAANAMTALANAAKDFTAECPMSFIDDVTKQVNKAMEDFILKQFERHGYSKEEITDLAIAEKVETVEYGKVTTYFVNGLGVFNIMRMEYDLSDEEDGYYNFTSKFICRDLIPAVKEE